MRKYFDNILVIEHMTYPVSYSIFLIVTTKIPYIIGNYDLKKVSQFLTLILA